MKQHCASFFAYFEGHSIIKNYENLFMGHSIALDEVILM